ncbi:MAG: lysophospholipid acyltransferase family protein [Deltaproteobacteria bacterium]|nr:lysophospholipid acyltransferase family protein [Deltaproteobacteria bacterium]
MEDRTVPIAVAFAEGSPLPPPPPPERWGRRWSRRVLSIGGYHAVAALLTISFVPLAVLGAMVDAVRRRRVAVRALGFFTFYFLCELAGIWASFGVWLGSGVWLGASRHRFLRWNFALQCWWARTLFGGARRIFRWKVEVEDHAAAASGPMLFFIRHLSTADTVLAAVFVSDRFGLCLRYVLKSELLWDPCLDIVGQRLPNGFVTRGTGDVERALAEVLRIEQALGPADGVLIYPEGTRFTPAKRRRALEQLAEKGDTALLERARKLERVLPPKLAGPLALLERNPGADVVFCVHTGYERAMSFREFLAGGLNDLLIHVGFWRVPFAEIPEERDARVAWLYDQWSRVDAWVQARER